MGWRHPLSTLRPALLHLRRFSYLLPASGTAYLWLKGQHPALPGWPCPLRALTGVPCPTCFLTRATAAALNLQLSDAVALHLFGLPAAALLVAWSVLSLRRRRLLPVTIHGWQLMLAALALLLYWALRLILSIAFGRMAFPDG